MKVCRVLVHGVWLRVCSDAGRVAVGCSTRTLLGLMDLATKGRLISTHIVLHLARTRRSGV